MCVLCVRCVSSLAGLQGIVYLSHSLNGRKKSSGSINNKVGLLYALEKGTGGEELGG